MRDLRPTAVALAVVGLLGTSIGVAAQDEADADATQPWIAYWGSGFDGEGARLIHPDGTGDHLIAGAFAGELALPEWSPDGQRLAMTSRDTGGTEPIYEYDLATESYYQLFDCEEPCLGDDDHAYSPDGTTMAFDRALGPFVDDVPSDCGIWLGDLATGMVTQLTSNPGCDREYFPRWSPDGSQLIYWRWREDESGTTGTAVFVLDADGTNERQLTEWEDFAGDPDWSPDGEWVVYNTYPLTAFGFDPVISNLYRMHLDGSGVEQLTFNEDSIVRATQPRYTPDGTSIVFTAHHSDPVSRELWVMPSDGGDPYVVAEGGIHTHGTWQPEG